MEQKFAPWDIFSLLNFKIKHAEILCSVCGDRRKAHRFHVPIHLVPYKALMIVGNVQAKGLAALAYSLDPVLLDKRLRKLEFILHQRIVARHIVVLSVHIVIENQSDLLHILVALKGV